MLELASRSHLPAVLSDYGLRLLAQIDGTSIFLVATARGTDEDALVSRLLADGEGRVVWAEPDRIAEAPELHRWTSGGADLRTIAMADYDARIADLLGQPALLRIGAPQSTWRGSGVLVAVLDTGVGPHPVLATVMRPGRNFVASEPQDLFQDQGNGVDDDLDGLTDEAVGHGTHIAGIIHAVAPEAEILSVRVLDSEGRGSVFAIAEGLRFAVDSGAQVINLSLGMPNKSGAIKKAIAYARNRAILVASAGNEGHQKPIQFPSSEEEVLSVAATELDDRKAPFSNFNRAIDIAAPGVSILSLYTAQEAAFATWTGTSMAAAFVSGAAAQARGARQDLTLSQVTELVLRTAADISAQNPEYPGQLGRGRLDLAALEVGLRTAWTVPSGTGALLLLPVALPAWLLATRARSGTRRK